MFQAFLTLVLLLTAVVGIASAQDAEVPINADGTLFVITREQEARLGLFTDFPGLLEARLFETPGGEFVLHIEYRDEGRLFVQRRPLTVPDVERLRLQVTDAIAARAPQSMLDQEGRTTLMLGAAALSIGYYGWAVPAAFEVDDSRTLVATYTLVSAAGFFGPFLATRHSSVTKGQAGLALYGGTRGVLHGNMAAAALDADGSEKYMGAGVAVGVVEALSGYWLAGRLHMTEGTADLTGTGGDLGVGIGLGTAYLAGMLDDTGDETSHSGWGVGIAGSCLGMVAGYRLAMTEPYTAGDNDIFRASSLVGGYLGFATALAIVGDNDDDLPKGTVAAALAGSGIGAVIGQRLVHDRDFRNSHGTFTSLGTLGGGLLGAGIGYLIEENQETVLASSAAGAAISFALLYASFAQAASPSEERTRIEMNFDPVALALARAGILPKQGNVPIVSARILF